MRILKVNPRFLVVFCVFFLSLISNSQERSIESLKQGFSEPGSSYRGKPFWSWNGRLEEEELLRQIDVMKAMGMGGFFMHSRTGLETEYLGEEWFRLINACADKAEATGMEAWLYDEDRWPSGLAGGLVTKYPEYRAKYLGLDTFSPSGFEPRKDYFAYFTCNLEGVDCYNYRRISGKEIQRLPADQTILAFFVGEKEKNSFYNGYTDVDRMSREATDYFIEITHEAYRKRCGDRLGNSIKGIFTDEPNRNAVLNSTENIRVPWTLKFAEEFKDRAGYDILDHLPELFYRPGGNAVSQVKWHYMEVAQQLFLENWLIPIYDWCEQNNFMLTGHFLHEDNLTSQAVMQGSLMRAYEYMHYPGIDLLTENNRNYWVAKQVQSVARQLGQKFVLSELYGATGWQFDFSDHKYVGDWQTLYGVNLRCHHLSWYTMQGQAKRDYPASIFFQSAWYPEYNYVETYFSRMGYLMNQGKPVCDVVYVSPVESLWSQIRVGWCNGLSPADPEIREIEAHYRKMFHILQENQIDFDYADEDMLRRHASVIMEDGNPLLKIGKAVYQTVVLGKMTTIRSSTLKILNAFVEAGGKVIFADHAPAYVDALPSDRARTLKQKAVSVPFISEEMARAIQEDNPVHCEVTDPETGIRIGDIFCQLRRDGDRKILMALNRSRENAYDNVLIRIKAAGNVTEWNAEDGELFHIPSRENKGYLEFEMPFARAQEYIFTITENKIKGAVPKPRLRLKEELPLSGTFRYSMDEPNVCLLDMGYVKIDGQEKTDLKEILKADQYIREFFGVPVRKGNMIQPWFRARFSEPPETLGKVKLFFPFYVDEKPVAALKLAMETPEEFDISLNGEKTSFKDQGWWVDNSIRVTELPAEFLKKGENMLVQEVAFSEEVNLEAIYLLGDFGVRLEGTKKIIGPLPEKITFGNLTRQGFPFYSGRITYEIEGLSVLEKGERAILKVPEYEAACIKVDPASENEKMIAWYPNEADVTSSIGSNQKLALEVVLTRRNLFGPFHFTPFTGVTSPEHFTPVGDHFTMDYMLNQSGILHPPVLRKFEQAEDH